MFDSRFSILDVERRNPEPHIQESSSSRLFSVPDGERVRKGAECVKIWMDELVEILDAELYQYSELLRLLYAQRESFAASDISSFEEITKKQETVVLKIKTLEEARKSIVSRLAQHFGIPHEGLTLARLATLVETQYSEKCETYQKEIISLTKELGDIRESNAYLMQQALHYVNGVLRIFASDHSADIAYSGNGQLEHRVEKGKRISGWG